MTATSPRLWVPSSLQRRTLLAFAILFASLAVIIGVLLHISNRNQGLASPAHRYHYLWTYFPSTTFIVISGLWYLVESNSKLLAPWRAIVDRPTDVSTSLRLDYSSEFRYVTLFTSAKNADWPVFIAVVGTFSLNIIIILSTGLLTVQSRAVVNANATFHLSTVFNRASEVQIPTQGLLTTHGLRYGLEFPNGTTSTFAYQTLDTSGLPKSVSDSRLIVDAFYPQSSCVNISGEWSFGYVQYRQNMSRVFPGVKRDLQWPGCRQRGAWGFKMDPGLVRTAAGLETYSLSVVPNPCEGTLAPNTTWKQFGVLASSMTLVDTNTSMADARKRYVQGTTTNDTVGFGEDVNGDGSIYFQAIPSAMLSSKIAGIVCTTSPRLGKAELSVSRDVLKVTAAIEDREQLDQRLGWQLQRAMYAALTNDAEYLTGYNSTPYIGSDFSLEKYSAQYAPFFQLVNDTNPRKAVKDIVDTDFLMKSVPAVIDRIAVQIAATDYFTDSQQETTGFMEVVQDRLVVTPLSCGFILGLLGLVTFIASALCTWSDGVVICDPATFAGTASLLVDRLDVLAMIQELDAKQTAHADRTYDKDNSLTVIAASASEGALDKDESKITTIVWWNPWSALLPISFLVLLLPCAGIALLEALFRLSQGSDGIATVSANRYTQYTWLYVPILLIFSLNSLFDAISSTNRTLQPYISMRERPSLASVSTKVDLIHRTTVSALFKAVKSGHLGVIAALAATLLGWTLPIAASSLFAARDVHQTMTIGLRQKDHFNPSSSLVSSSSVHDNFLPLPGLILYNNLSQPRWTYGKYAFPQLDFAQSSVNRTQYPTAYATLRLELPAIYGVANCTVQQNAKWAVDLSGNRTTTDPSGRIFPVITLEAKTPEGCPAMPCDLMASLDDFYMANWKSFAQVQSFNNITTFRQGAASYNTSASSYHGGTVLPAHCPRSVMCTAKGTAHARYVDDVPGANTTRPTLNAGKVMHCSPYVEQELVQLELALPGFTMMSSKPPVPVVGTRQFFSETELISNANFGWYLPHKAFVESEGHTAESDDFFRAVTSTSGGIDPVAIASNDANGMQALNHRIDEIYGMVVAQVYSEKRRFAGLATDSSSDLNGTIIAVTTSRIFQDEASTRIIQVVLAAMIICALGTILFTDGRRILPDRPCSIATIAGLLSRSSLLGDRAYLLDQDSSCDMDLCEMDVRYSLGWRGGLRSRWYGVDVGKADMFE
jgi:hypothetical protein